eukprot:TRINITY_DN283_c0_g2_i5.p1 TRINITY_DN283_c0_g2~~TRINITY_DN283_c0_g2_i5.p1  ORF type:complete len:167 (-),score=47.85 TRINITY_DN283_c0_g2_i5:927-1427(-)
MQLKALGSTNLRGQDAQTMRAMVEQLDAKEAIALKGESCLIGYSETDMKLLERRVAVLMETDMASAMQFLQSKQLILVPTTSVLTRPLGPEDEDKESEGEVIAGGAASGSGGSGMPSSSGEEEEEEQGDNEWLEPAPNALHDDDLDDIDDDMLIADFEDGDQWGDA